MILLQDFVKMIYKIEDEDTDEGSADLDMEEQKQQSNWVFLFALFQGSGIHYP